jgi:hypothetical protein
MAETEDLKSFQCRFESDWGHGVVSFERVGICTTPVDISPKGQDPSQRYGYSHSLHHILVWCKKRF